MRRFPILLVILLVAACSGRTPGDPNRDLQWRTSLRSDEVRVVLFDRTGAYQIDRIVLVGPNGEQIPAREMTRENQSGPGRGVGIGVGGSYGSRSGAGLGLGMSVPLDDDYAASIERRTTASITLPDPARYRQTAAQWRLEIDMITPGGVAHHATIPAPIP